MTTTQGQTSPKDIRESGDQDYHQLRQQLEKAVRQICPHWLRDKSEDLVQVALIRVFEIRRKSEGDRNFSSSYLWRVAYSALIDEIRRLRRRKESDISDEDLEREAVLQEPDPEASLAGTQIGEGIQHCLQKLVVSRRMAMTLYLQGYSVPSAAEVLGFSAKKTENLVYRGLQQLRECLRKKGFKP